MSKLVNVVLVYFQVHTLTLTYLEYIIKVLGVVFTQLFNLE